MIRIWFSILALRGAPFRLRNMAIAVLTSQATHERDVREPLLALLPHLEPRILERLLKQLTPALVYQNVAEAYFEFMGDASSGVRHAATAGLTTRGDSPWVREKLLATLNDPSPYRRENAARALSACTEFAEIQRALVAKLSASRDERIAAAQSLAEIKSLAPSAANILQSLVMQAQVGDLPELEKPFSVLTRQPELRALIRDLLLDSSLQEILRCFCLNVLKQQVHDDEIVAAIKQVAQEPQTTVLRSEALQVLEPFGGLAA